MSEQNAKWRERKYNDGTMTLWHGSPQRFKESILKQGILPRCALPITNETLDKTTKELAQKIEQVHGVKPSAETMEKAKHFARERIQMTHGCVYTSGDKEYAKGNCLAGDEWQHGLAQYLLGSLKDEGKLPRELNITIASHRFYPDMKCAVFSLEVPVKDAKSVEENKDTFRIYEEKYNDPSIRKHFAGTDDWYRQIFTVVNLNKVNPSQIKKVEEHQKF